jgi:hypothetical protein
VISSFEITFNLSFGITSKVSTFSCSLSIPVWACFERLMPSNEKGRVTTPTVKAPVSLAMSAITGAAPVPVPPPIPAATNIILESRIISYISSLLSSADAAPLSGSPPTPIP